MTGAKLDVLFNGESLREKFGIGLINYEIQSASSRKTRGIDIPGRDGSYKVNSAFSSKNIKLSVVVEGGTSEEVHRKVRVFLSWLSQQNEPKIIFTDNPNVFIKADLDKSSEYYVTRGTENAMTYLTIDLFQYDPFTYDNGKISYSLEVINGKEYNVQNDGMYTPYIIYISSAQSTLSEYMATSIGHSNIDNMKSASNIIITVNGIRQEFQGVIGNNDVLEINSRELTVTKNNENSISSWQGDIEDLVYGNNTISIKSMEGINLYMTIEFYRRWL